MHMMLELVLTIIEISPRKTLEHWFTGTLINILNFLHFQILSIRKKSTTVCAKKPIFVDFIFFGTVVIMTWLFHMWALKNG